MSLELEDILENYCIHVKKMIHDCVDTGNSVSLVANNAIDFPCDCVTRDYKTYDNLWNPLTSNFKNHIDNGKVDFKIKATLNGASNAICTIRIFVPHPTFGDIEVDEHDWVCYKNNIDTNFEWSSFIYMGTDSEAKTYGFNVEIIPRANMTLKGRSILLIS